MSPYLLIGNDKPTHHLGVVEVVEVDNGRPGNCLGFKVFESTVAPADGKKNGHHRVLTGDGEAQVGFDIEVTKTCTCFVKVRIFPDCEVIKSRSGMAVPAFEFVPRSYGRDTFSMNAGDTLTVTLPSVLFDIEPPS